MAERLTPERLTLKYQVLTPLFMGDAEQTRAELRPPSFKALLRFWYRAVSGEFNRVDSAWCEDRLFGSSNGQSPFLLSLKASDTDSWRWDQRLLKRFDRGHGRNTRNGLRYLGYPFDLLERNSRGREAIAPGAHITLTCLFPRGASSEQRRGLLAAAWLLGHLGGAGSRSRRGFGSLSLRDWSAPDHWNDDRDALPLLHTTRDASAWTQGFQQARQPLKDWFPGFGKRPLHPHIGKNFQHRLIADTGKDWSSVLAGMGQRMQDFRLRREPDYSDIKRQYQGHGHVSQAPQRAAFGLPLTFRYSSARGQPVSFMPFDPQQGTTGERQASLLHLRVVALADGLHPLYLRLDGAVPGEQTPEKDPAGRAVAVRHERRSLRPASGNLLDQFMNHLSGKH